MAWREKVTEQTRTMGFFDLVRAGTSQSVQAAISNGADVNARNSYDKTPLMYAAMYNQNPEVITALLAAGADIKVRDKYGRSPLMAAARDNQNPEVITILLKAGADGKAKSSAGKTAFDYAQGNAKLKGTDAYRKLQEASK
jgi:ankyrin repeat protein